MKFMYFTLSISLHNKIIFLSENHAINLKTFCSIENYLFDLRVRLCIGRGAV